MKPKLNLLRFEERNQNRIKIISALSPCLA